MRTSIISSLLLSLTGISFGQQEYLDHPIDVLHYDITLELEDTTDEIKGYEVITFNLKHPCDSFFIDFGSQNNSTGMKISPQLSIDYENVKYRHENDRIWIQTPDSWDVGSTHEAKLYYKGVPETGLIIGKNKFGNRTFFGDNWPNRAHHWFACVDHPIDKATIQYSVITPDHYGCIATGDYISKKKVGDGSKLQYDFKTSINLPTKVMVIGVAEFVWDLYKPDPGFDVSVWVYPENREEGFSDMEVSLEVLEYFIEIVGEYPFEKLANVQSTTQFGGMENAGNIFYDENAVTGEGKMEALIAHEIAHQWFGNSASEEDWQHLWLSEGFATYLTDLYWEHKYGLAAMNERLITERIRVVNFAKKYDHPVVDTKYADLMHLLNPNSYQKGAWFLHMLREKVGDEAFFASLQAYYAKYKLKNANTADFREVVEVISGELLIPFFEQWLYTSGHPILSFETQKGSGATTLIVNQVQEGTPFEFDLEVQVNYADGMNELVIISVKETFTSQLISSEKKIESFEYDPNVKLLFEITEN